MSAGLLDGAFVYAEAILEREGQQAADGYLGDDFVRLIAEAYLAGRRSVFAVQPPSEGQRAAQRDARLARMQRGIEAAQAALEAGPRIEPGVTAHIETDREREVRLSPKPIRVEIRRG